MYKIRIYLFFYLRKSIFSVLNTVSGIIFAKNKQIITILKNGISVNFMGIPLIVVGR